MDSQGGWVSLPERRSAELALRRAARAVVARRCGRTSPLFLHGPSGTGKTYLVENVVEELAPPLVVLVLSANDMGRPGEESLRRSADLLVVEDVQHLPGRNIELLVRSLDEAQARRCQVILTSTRGPARIPRWPARLRSRAASGLVVEVPAWSATSRLSFLRQRAHERGLHLADEVVTWLAEQLPGSGRQLEGALERLHSLRKMGSTLELAAARQAFLLGREEQGPDVEEVVRRVSRYFRLRPKQVLSKARTRQIVLARQVVMYLLWRVLGLSLHQVAGCLGGRDHTTVLHACRKVERGVTEEAPLAAAVGQLLAELGPGPRKRSA